MWSLCETGIFLLPRCDYNAVRIVRVAEIKVYENGNISVHFKFADEFRRIAEYIEINTTDTTEVG